MKAFLILIAISITFISYGQIDKSKIKEQAELTAKALLEDDFETLIGFTYPKVIELVGGRDKMISLIKNGKVEMAQQGIRFETVAIGEATDTVKAGNEIHCLIPQTIVMKSRNGKIKSETYLLAISKNEGEHWFFIDTVKLTMDNIKSILPNYNSELILPAKKSPQLIRD